MVLPQLPGELFMLIFKCLGLTLTELSLMRTVSKDFNRVVNPELRDRFWNIQPTLRNLSVNLQDPLYYGYTDHIPAWGLFNEYMGEAMKKDHFKRLLRFKNLPPAQLDRLFGYMFENREAYGKVVTDPNNYLPSPTYLKRQSITRNLIKYIKKNIFTQDNYYKFISLLRSADSVAIQNESAGIDFYYDKYIQSVDVDSELLSENLHVFCKLRALMREKFLHDFPLLLHVMQATYFAFFSWLYDMNFYCRLLDSLVNVLVHRLPSSWIIYLVYKTVFFVAVFIFACTVSPSWIFLKHVDRSIASCAANQNKMIELALFATVIVLDLVLVAISLLETAICYLEPFFGTELTLSWYVKVRKIYNHQHENVQYWEHYLESHRGKPFIPEDDEEELDDEVDYSQRMYGAFHGF